MWKILGNNLEANAATFLALAARKQRSSEKSS